MRNIVVSFFNRSMRGKLVLYFLLVILFPTITITILGNLMYRNSMSEEQNINTQQMISQISNNVDFYIKNIENVVDYLSNDPKVLKFLTCNDVDQNYSDGSIKSDAYNSINSFVRLHPEMAGIMIVNKNDVYVSDIMYRISRDPLTSEKWYLKAVQNPRNINLFSKPVGRNINNVFNYCADDVVSMSKAVFDNTGNCIGVILIDMKLDIIKQVIENAKPGKTGFIYIVDSEGEIVYSPVNPIVYRIAKEWCFDKNSEIVIKKIKNKDYEIMNLGSKYTKWKTVGVFPLDEIQKVITYIKYYSLIIAVITLILAGILAIFFTRSIIRPITKLRMLMKMAEEGNLNVHFNNKYNDEIGELGNSFNTMIREIKTLISLVQIEEKKKRKAEISILQAQIKPHFLYNTLDTIQWMAKEKEAQDIAQMVSNLSNLLRTGLNDGDEIIRLSGEIKHVESYLMIQKVRYEDKLNYEIKIDESILDYNIIKLILQPLVENAIYHGIKEKRGKGKITIIGNLENNKIHIRVIDNGIGINEDKLQTINSLLSGNGTVTNKLGYGIFNVNERIKLNYGDEFGLAYDSTYGQGTTVHVWHPTLE